MLTWLSLAAIGTLALIVLRMTRRAELDQPVELRPKKPS